MQPTKENNSHIEIPLTFDSKRKGRQSAASRVFFGLALALIWIFCLLLSLAKDTVGGKLLWMMISTAGFIYLLRFLYFREKYYREKRAILEKNNYLFDTSLLWSIVEVSNDYPCTVTFRNGYKGVFVALDKGVIVGKDDGFMYDHHSAIADVYKDLANSDIEFSHLDFMDSIGKDNRLTSLFSAASTIKGKHLRDLITMKYDYLEKSMQRAYSTYDVYCMYWKKDDVEAKQDIMSAVGAFKRANFSRTRFLNKYEIGVLVQTLFNLTNFSLNTAVETSLGKDSSSYLKVIWGEKDGVKTVLAQTSEERKAERRVSSDEKRLKRRKWFFGKKNKANPEEDINLD